MAANRSPAPLVPANSTRPRSNIEEAAVEDYSGELRRKKRIKFRMVSATFDNFTVGTPSSPSFDLNMNAQLGVKNTNFGNFRYPSTTMYLYYRGTQVGEALVPKANVGWRTTRKFDVVVKLSSANLTSNSQVLADDINAGVLPITSQSDLRGKVRLTFIFKKKKSSKMNCTMDVFTATQQLSNISCK
ncbi:late embryogenesis abundant protein At1g64065-like [Coffea eugenioides]|uniref:late embryogenesis abundant protein At1g64065-like n=1 Tax=Coffea eugenioides TaxID=49369 RepID=UPI000F5C52AC|nr:late embryogenesis abundant protein At1g64065-like [Coffea arabica]XP_027163654.1 late embryogenesis abundant protein At1g64065-like [Coffea eugenioides]